MTDPRLFLVFKKPGEAWKAGVPTRGQRLWDEHAAYIDNLFDQGRIMMAGPYADWSGALVIVRAVSPEEAAGLFDDDPWRLQDILHVDQVKEWVVFLDDRPKSEQPHAIVSDLGGPERRSIR